MHHVCLLPSPSALMFGIPTRPHSRPQGGGPRSEGLRSPIRRTRAACVTPGTGGVNGADTSARPHDCGVPTERGAPRTLTDSGA
jgi:hypothetical protein